MSTNSAEDDATESAFLPRVLVVTTYSSEPLAMVGNSIGADWTADELDLILADYLQMLQAGAGRQKLLES